MSQLVCLIGLHEQSTEAEIEDMAKAVRKVAWGLKRKAGA
jgi:hypothetical protein